MIGFLQFCSYKCVVNCANERWNIVGYLILTTLNVHRYSRRSNVILLIYLCWLKCIFKSFLLSPCYFAFFLFCKSIYTITWFWIDLVERKKLEAEKESKVILMPLQHTLFIYKWKLRVLLQIIHAVLAKRSAEAELIALSIFFFRHVFGVFFNQIYVLPFKQLLLSTLHLVCDNIKANSTNCSKKGLLLRN